MLLLERCARKFVAKAWNRRFRVYALSPCLQLTFIRYSFTLKVSYARQSSLYCPLHLHCSHCCNTIARLLQCAIYDPHPTPLVYAIHHTGLTQYWQRQYRVKPKGAGGVRWVYTHVHPPTHPHMYPPTHTQTRTQHTHPPTQTNSHMHTRTLT